MGLCTAPAIGAAPASRQSFARGLPALPLLLLAGCFPYRSTVFYPSATVVDEQFFGVRPGRAHVFEVCRQWSAPFPDAATGYCFRLSVDPRLLGERDDIPIPGRGVEPSLWKLHGAPRTVQSRAARGRLRVRRLTPDRIVADLDVDDGTVPGGWRLRGVRAFRRRAIPEPPAPPRLPAGLSP